MLKTLELNDIEFADSAELPDFTDFVSLDSLGLSRNLMREIDALKLPSTLRSLDLSDNDLDDIDALVPFDFLTSLHLGNNEHLSFEDVEVIDHFAASLNTDFPFFMVKQAVQDRIGDIALRNCVFDKGMVSAWSQVESYRNLECIGEGIISVDGLAFYSQLSSLTLSGNALTFFDIDGSMPNLRLLDLSGNDIDSFAELSILEELTELILAGNRISDLNGISGLVNLTDLSIANNQLTSLHGIEGLHFLTKLNAQNNAIEEVPDLSVLNWLTVLRLGSNNIDNINLTNIATAPAALELNLNNNSVITQLDNLYGMSRLNQIYLIGTVLECQEMVDLKAAIAGLEIIQDRGCVL